MKKQFATILAATAVLGVTTAFAANPFSDVTPDSWAYQAVSQLAQSGIVNGYPDGTFKGQHNITRFEMAQMVAKAMARQDRVDAEQNAIINRLANEFATELNNLGVRVSTLENKVGNFSFTGDARLRYQNSKNEDTKTYKSKFDYRARVQFEAAVNDNTKAVVRLAGEKDGEKDEFGSAGNPTTSLDRVYVQHNFGKYATATVGRQDLVVGNGLVYDDAFEGAAATVGKDKLNASVAYGYLQGGEYNGLKLDEATRAKNSQVTVYQLNTMPTEKLAVKGFYADVHEKGVNSVYGASVDAKLGSKVWVGGEYAKQETKGAAGEAWTAGLGYGEADMAKAGTWGAKVQYFDLKKEAPVVSNTWNVPKANNYKGYLATVDYTVAKNVGLSAYATFDSKTQAKKDNNLPEYYRAELNYKF